MEEKAQYNKSKSSYMASSRGSAPPIPDTMNDLSARVSFNEVRPGGRRPLPATPSPAPVEEQTGSTRGTQRYNFGLASSRDALVFGAERPGMNKPRPELELTPRGPSVTSAVVNEWCSHLRSQGIKRVVSVLTHAELSFYEKPLIMQYQSHFSRVVPLSATDGDLLPKAMGAIFEAVEANEPIVVHCSTGQTRTAALLACYLVQRYHLTVPRACDEVQAFGDLCGVIRRPRPAAVVDLLMGAPAAGGGFASARGPDSRMSLGGGGGDAFPLGSGLGRSRSASLGPAAWEDPHHPPALHIVFLQMGGHIDHDYLKGVQGSSLEVGAPAVGRILAQIAKRAGGLNFTYEIVTVCRKDSQAISREDKEALAAAIHGSGNTHFVVTHGCDSMLPTAAFIDKHECMRGPPAPPARGAGAAPGGAEGPGSAPPPRRGSAAAAAAAPARDKVVVFTGAFFPQRFTESDAAFNVGGAVAALRGLGPGVYVAMNGLLAEHARCARDVRTGMFRVKKPEAGAATAAAAAAAGGAGGGGGGGNHSGGEGGGGAGLASGSNSS